MFDPILPPVSINVAITSVYRVMAVWMPVIVVPRSLATVAMDTFITELSRVMRNWPAARVGRTRPAPVAAARPMSSLVADTSGTVRDTMRGRPHHPPQVTVRPDRRGCVAEGNGRVAREVGFRSDALRWSHIRAGRPGIRLRHVVLPCCPGRWFWHVVLARGSGTWFWHVVLTRRALPGATDRPPRGPARCFRPPRGPAPTVSVTCHPRSVTSAQVPRSGTTATHLAVRHPPGVSRRNCPVTGVGTTGWSGFLSIELPGRRRQSGSTPPGW